MFFPVGASDAVCAHDGFAVVAHHANHHELPVFKAQAFVARAGEAEIGIGPMVYGEDFLGVVCCHGGAFC